MKTKGLVIALVTSLVALISAPVTILSLTLFTPDVYYKTYYAGMKNKLELLKNTKGKRIIIVGGSSVPFSIDSKLIKQELPEYNVVDFGLYASLGTPIMLELLEHKVHKDDFIILSPEISSQTLSNYYNGLETLKALEQNKDEFFTLSSEAKERIIGALPIYNSEKISYLSQNNIPTPTDIYSIDSFNEYGDVSATREGNIMLNGIDSNHLIDLNKEIIDEKFVEKVNIFSKNLANLTPNVYFRFSPINDSAIINKNNLEHFYEYLDSKIEMEILSDPFKAILEKEWFYDTNYHLNSAGAIKRTKDLIKDIKLILNDTLPTNINVPNKPPLIEEEINSDADSSDLKYFTYEEKEKNVVITGLAESGKTRKTLQIPYIFNKKVINSFSSETFKNSDVEEIIIQDNIKIINDYSFSNTKIKRIIIKNNVPNSIGIGDHLLDGSDALIYVPHDKLTSYKTSYAWSPYAEKIFALID